MTTTVSGVNTQGDCIGYYSDEIPLAAPDFILSDGNIMEIFIETNIPTTISPINILFGFISINGIKVLDDDSPSTYFVNTIDTGGTLGIVVIFLTQNITTPINETINSIQLVLTTSPVGTPSVFDIFTGGDITLLEIRPNGNPIVLPVPTSSITQPDDTICVHPYAPGPPPCDAPSVLQATNVSDIGATLSWTDTNAPLADDYTIFYGSGVAPTVGITDMNVINNPHVISGLTPETYYEWNIIANCSSGSSDVSIWGNFTTLATCNPPTDLNAIVDSSGSSVTLTWTDNNVPPTSEYEVYYTNITDGDYGTNTPINTGSSTTAILTTSTPNIVIGETYNYYVKAICGPTVSGDSAPSMFTMIPPPVTPPPTATPPAIPPATTIAINRQTFDYNILILILILLTLIGIIIVYM